MAGINAFGTVWQMHDGVSAFVTVDEVVSIDALDASVDELDVTSHESPGGWREFIGGLKDGGSLSMEVNYDPALHQTLFGALGAKRQQKVIFPDAGAAEVAFSAVVAGFSASAPHDDKLSATVTLKVTGAITITL